MGEEIRFYLTHHIQDVALLSGYLVQVSLMAKGYDESAAYLPISSPLELLGKEVHQRRDTP